jgi:glycosyltransferase involved in cell wall biosynthesis
LSTAVSIICPYRNAAGFLSGLIANVRQQTHGDWELLLVDDGSTDAGPALAEEAAAADSRIRAVRAPLRTAGTAAGPWWPRNVGLRHARHGLIAFLDVDDLWHPRKLERQLRFHQERGLDLSVTGYVRFRQGSERLSSWRCPPLELDHRRLLRGNVIPLLTVMVRRDCLAEGFRAVPHEDYLLWLDLFGQKPDLAYGCLPELLAAYRLHGGNLTARRPALLGWVYRVHRAHRRNLLNSAAGVAAWTSHQIETGLRGRLRPLRGTLSELLGAEPPWRLPPH